MATIHQRRQAPSSQHSETDLEESDWHVVNSASPSGRASLGRRSSFHSSSPVLEFESDVLVLTTDDDEEQPHLTTASDLEPTSAAYADGLAFTTLPSHDGEGNFGAPHSTDDDIEHIGAMTSPPRRARSRIHLPADAAFPPSPGSDSSLPNLLLPGGGLPLPKFARASSGPGQPLRLNLGRRKNTGSSTDQPQFQPTITRTSSTLPRTVTPTLFDPTQHQQQPSEVLGELGYPDSGTSPPSSHGHEDPLDQNPMHHPTLLTTLWHHLYRLAADLLADAGSLDPTTLTSSPTFSHQNPQYHPGGYSGAEPSSVTDRIALLTREARDEGLLPFGSHMLGYGFARRGSLSDTGSGGDDWGRAGGSSNSFSGGIRRCQSEVAIEEGPRREKRRGSRRERERPRSIVVG